MKSKRCVYLIRNLVNGRIYVGSTINFPQRKWRHLYDLKKGKHCSRFMQRDFNKCGGDAFVIEVLEVVSETDDLIAREQHWLDTLQPPYNSAKIAGTVLGVKQPPEAVQKNRERNTGFGNGNARITHEDAKRIVSMIGAMTLDEIAKKHGVSRTTIQRLLRRIGISTVKRCYDEKSRELFSENAKNNIAGRNARAVNVLFHGDLIAKTFESTWLAAAQIGMNNSTLAKALKREAQVIRDGFCVSYAPINPAMVAWPYRRGQAHLGRVAMGRSV